MCTLTRETSRYEHVLIRKNTAGSDLHDSDVSVLTVQFEIPSHIMFGGRNNLWKPKNGVLKSYVSPPLLSSGRTRKSKYTILLVAMLLIHLVFDPIGVVSRFSHRLSMTRQEYPKPHCFSSSQLIFSDLRYIFPSIGDYSLLKELTVEKLMMKVNVHDANNPNSAKSIIRHMNNFDDTDPAVQMAKEAEENEVSDLKRAQNTFKNLDKVAYRHVSSAKYPKVVIVTLLDFDQYGHDLLVKIIQNRIDYAHKHNFALYARWAQEFLPLYNSFEAMHKPEKAHWARLYCTRAAMLAFPDAEWFWFLDENGLIVNMDINIEEQLLTPDKLKSLAMQNQPITPPDGDIRTFRTADPEDFKVITLQAFDMMQSFSFVVRNDDLGEAYLNVWSDKLYLGYSKFAAGPDSALSHMLHWHPYLLKSTAIVPANYLASVAPNLKPAVDTSDVFYEEGDLAVYWGRCQSVQECEEKVDLYYKENH